MARLPQGVTKRKNGLFEKRFTVDGKRYSVYGHTTKELAEKEQKKRKEIEQNLNQSLQGITLNKYFERFLNQKRGYVKSTTIYKYQRVYESRIKADLGNKKLKTLTKVKLMDYQEKLLKDGVSPDYINYIFVVLKSVFASALTDEIIIKNPLIGTKKLKSQKDKASDTIHRALTEEETKLFLNQLRATQNWYYEIYALMVNTGMRLGECLALEWSDIDNINEVIHITKTLTVAEDGSITVGEPKTKTSKRDIPITDNIKTLLKSQRRKYNMLAESGELKRNIIFPSVRGNYIDKTTIGRNIDIIVKQLQEQGHKIEPFGSHALRDTFATRFIEQGGQPQTLKTILGHSSLAMTMDLYAHVLPNTKAEEMKRIVIAI